VVLATNNLFVGGAQQLIVTLAAHLPEHGWRVTVLDLVGGPDRLAGAAEPMRDAVVATGAPLVDFTIRSITDRLEWRRARAWMTAQSPDVVHGHLSPSDRWSAMLARGTGARTITTKHDTYTHLSMRARWTEALAYRLLFDRVVAISDATSWHLTTRFHVPGAKLIVVPNPVNAAAFRPDPAARASIRAEWSIGEDALVVGYVGRLVARKGLSAWFHAAAHLAVSRPEVRFVVVGTGPDEPALRVQAEALGITERVHFVGRRTDVAACYNGFDVFLFTPVSGEGLPIAVLEAMATGLPIVASNVGANSELLEGCGLLPEPASWVFEATTLDPEPIARAAERLLASAELRAQLGRSARARILSNYDVDVAVSKQARVYDELVAQPQLPLT
jgi:glycosyltransferase involved in cell wall biosynthesis